jgi:hypothetical protein
MIFSIDQHSTLYDKPFKAFRKVALNKWIGMAKRKPTSEEDVEKLKLPPIPQPESKAEKTEKTEELETIEEISEAPKQRRQQGGWTREDVEVLLKLAMDFLGTNLADKYLTYKKNDAESRRHYFESVSNHNRKMIYVLMLFLVGIVGFMSLLTWYEKVSGDALLFLVGTITGYIIISVQRLVFPSEEPPTEEPEN